MKYIILGAGQAGFMTAKTIRENDAESDIFVFDTEKCGLYSKVRLPEFVAGTIPEGKLMLANEEAFHALNIQTFFGTQVSLIHRNVHQIQIEGGQLFPYDKLILATGADAFIPQVNDLDLVRYFKLRTLNDAKRIIETAETGHKKALIVGGGLLGLEAAWALTQRGCDATVAEFMDRLLPKQLNGKQSAVLQEKLSGMGMKFKLNTSLNSVEKVNDGTIRAVFNDGFAMECSLLLFAAGIRARTDLAKKAKLEVGRAIQVNHRLQTSDPDIFAAGDCAEIDGITPGLWMAARDQGIALGEILTGKRNHFDPPAYSPALKIAGLPVKDICGTTGDTSA